MSNRLIMALLGTLCCRFGDASLFDVVVFLSVSIAAFWLSSLLLVSMQCYVVISEARCLALLGLLDCFIKCDSPSSRYMHQLL